MSMWMLLFELQVNSRHVYNMPYELLDIILRSYV